MVNFESGKARHGPLHACPCQHFVEPTSPISYKEWCHLDDSPHGATLTGGGDP